MGFTLSAYRTWCIEWNKQGRFIVELLGCAQSAMFHRRKDTQSAHKRISKYLDARASLGQNKNTANTQRASQKTRKWHRGDHHKPFWVCLSSPSEHVYWDYSWQYIASPPTRLLTHSSQMVKWEIILLPWWHSHTDNYASLKAQISSNATLGCPWQGLGLRASAFIFLSIHIPLQINGRSDLHNGFWCTVSSSTALAVLFMLADILIKHTS